MINPLRNLKGKLNHIRVPATQMMKVFLTANSIPCNGSSLAEDTTSAEDILALKSNTTSIDQRRFHKLEFELMVHSQKAVYGLPSTIFDELSAYEKKVSLTLSSFTADLSPRQLLYLNMAIRTKINKEHPDWDRLHLAPESPFKAEW